MTRRPPPKARTPREHEERFERDPDEALDLREDLRNMPRDPDGDGAYTQWREARDLEAARWEREKGEGS